MREIYFDYSATTKMSEGAIKKMTETAEVCYGNPSSLHTKGLSAESVVSDARKTILSSLGITRSTQGCLVFTSGGTEANNLAILGTVFAKHRTEKKKILITAGEHSSVENCAAHLEENGFTVCRIPTRRGSLDLDFIKENAKGTTLASLMHINNETGAVYDVSKAFSVIKEICPCAITHSDCVQSYMKIKFAPSALGADLVSISSHKINGPKGTGALYISSDIIKAKKITPVIFGGGQESGLRSGTENVYGIAAFAEAAKEHSKTLADDISKTEALRSYIIKLLQAADGIRLNIPERCAPHILNITIDGIKSETMLHFLSSKGIYVSSGSACSSHSKGKVSRALAAFGLSDNDADCSLRISLGPDNTQNDADCLADALKEGIARLVKVRTRRK